MNAHLPIVHHDTALVAECELIRGEEGTEQLGLLYDWTERVRIENPEVYRAIVWLAHEADEQARTHALSAMGMTYHLLGAQREVEALRRMAAPAPRDWSYLGLALLATVGVLFALAIFAFGGGD